MFPPAQPPARACRPASTCYLAPRPLGECLLDVDEEEGGASERCEELSEALGALQLSLGVKGRVVATAKNAVAPERK